MKAKVRTRRSLSAAAVGTARHHRNRTAEIPGKVYQETNNFAPNCKGLLDTQAAFPSMSQPPLVTGGKEDSYDEPAMEFEKELEGANHKQLGELKR